MHLNYTSWSAIRGLSSSSGNGEDREIKRFITCGKRCTSHVLSRVLLPCAEGFILTEHGLPPCSLPHRQEHVDGDVACLRSHVSRTAVLFIVGQQS